MSEIKQEIVVVGGGLAGYATAIALADEGFETALVAPTRGETDRRSTALLGSSVAFLDQIGIMSRLRDAAEPLATMRLVDDTRRLLRAPTVEFRAGEIGLDCFGYNVLNERIGDVLAERAGELDTRLRIIDAPAVELRSEDNTATVRLGDGTSIHASLAVGADGRRSVVREGAGIAMREWSYPQRALVMNFEHDLPHQGVSTEFHTRTGPFTQVPLPGGRSSLVWVEEPATADLLVDVDRERLGEMVEEKLHSILGTVRIDGPVQAFPLSGAIATAMSGNRVALVGEAAHVFPPIGAQGLNLGLRDAAELVRAVCDSRDDPGRRSALRRYEARRRADVLSRTAAVDALNRSLLLGFLPVQMGRSLGLSAMAGIAPLRRFLMREGTVPGAGFLGIPDSLRTAFGNVGHAADPLA